MKIYVYGYLNQVHSSRRLEREAKRNVELMWLTGRLAPDLKTIAEFRRNNGEAIHRLVCREFVMLCRKLNLLSDTLAIDGSKFKAVNNRDKNFTKAKMKSRGSGIVGYNVQTAVDVKTHLIVVHEVTNAVIDRRSSATSPKTMNTSVPQASERSIGSRGLKPE